MGIFTSLKNLFTFELKLKIFLRLPVSQPCVIQTESRINEQHSVLCTGKQLLMLHFFS